MKLANTQYKIRKSKDGSWKTNVFTGRYETTFDENEILVLKQISRVFRSKKYSTSAKLNWLKENFINNKVIVDLVTSTDTTESNTSPEGVTISNVELIENSIQKLMDFFTEFQFEPNFRFINTFAYCANKSKSSAKDYIKNYFELTDNQDTNQIIEKMKSEEFNNIIENFSKVEPTHRVNSRFKLYYGSQGTGKTTIGMKESEGNCMVCHSAMLPNDLMEDFKFEDGKAAFKPSALQNAIIEGKTIVLDEINLLPFESLRFLQSILDGKKQFEYKGTTITIHDNFKIIGTMNLTVNGSTYSLPEPLVDRCEEIKKFKLSAKDLVGAIC